MTYESKKPLDSIGRKILLALQENARVSFAELGRLVGLTAPGVAERVRRMEDEGIITAYRAEINPNKVGLNITAFIRISAQSDVLARVVAAVKNTPEVIECHRGTGSDCFILKTLLSSISELERVIDRFTSFGQVTTSIVLSTPLQSRIIEPPALERGK